MTTDKITDRIRKLLELSHSDNEHEAAQAAARAAALMAEHAVTEAMLEVLDEDHVAETIIEGNLGAEHLTARRVAWRDRIASACAKSLGCETFIWNRNLHAMGRESAVQTWAYTSAYLFAEVSRLADEAWLREGADLVAVGQRPRAWKGSFRLGAAGVIAERLREAVQDRQAAQRTTARAAAQLAPGSDPTLALTRATQALAIVDRGAAEVKAAFTKHTTGPGWRTAAAIGRVTNASGYHAGREAGRTVSLGATGPALGASQSRLKGGGS